MRAAAVGLLAVLSLTGALEIWHIVGLVVFYGAGAAFFAPAFDAIVPELLPAERLAQANALDQMVRPIAMRLAGPALGGVVIGAFGTGTAFALDAATFLVSAAALLAMRPRAARPAPAGASRARRPARGLALRAPPLLAVGDVRQRRDRLPAVHGPGRGPAAAARQARAARDRDRARARLRGGRARLRGLRRGARPARAAAARRHVHVRGLDARDARGRRLRAVDRRSGS